MEVVFRELDGLAKCSVLLEKDKVKFFYKSLVREFHKEFNYSDLVEITRMKDGDKEWTNIGYSMLGIAFFSLIFLNFYTVYARLIAGIIAVASVIPFGLRFRKEEWAYFYKEKSEFAFSIKITKENKGDVEKAIELIESKRKSKKRTPKKAK